MDFVNDPSDIQESFQPYYQGTVLTENTDPNKLYDIEREVKKYNLFQEKVRRRILPQQKIFDQEITSMILMILSRWVLP